MKRLTTGDFVIKARRVHGDKYDYSKAVYARAHAKVCIICPDHGEFWQTPSHHTNGANPTGCPGCGLLVKGERVCVDDILLPLGVKAIPLTRGSYTIVDEEDYEWLSNHNWYLNKPTYSIRGYAYCTINKKATVMHKLLLNPSPGKEVDHINGDSLDNRKSNLRVCSRVENVRNLPPICKTSKYKGVYFDKNAGKWKATISINGKQTHLGTFSLEEDAAVAYDTAAKIHYQEYARLNFK